MAWSQQQTGWSYADKRTARELAYHEAGHAVLQHENGYKVTSIHINPGAVTNAGSTRCDPNATPSPPPITTYNDLKSYFVSLGAAYVAGVISEFIDAGGKLPLPEFPSLLQYGDSQQANGLFQKFSKLEQSWNAVKHTSHVTTFADFLSDACDHAFDVLTRRRADLDAAANALLAKNQLGAADCAILLP